MIDQLTLAQRIRKFWRDLFGSRLVEHLEAEIFLQQTMYDARLLERDQTIASLRQEALRLQAKFDEFESDPTYFWWLAERGKRTTPPQPDLSSLSEVPARKSWAQIQADHYAAEEAELSKESSNGVSDSGRGESIREQVPGLAI